MLARQAVVHRLTIVVVFVGLALSACSSDEDPVLGVDAGAVANPTELMDELQQSGVACETTAAFDPTENIAPDGFDYEKPAGLICESSASTFYAVVYESMADRVEALDHGEINADLCEISAGEGADPVGWFSVVGANWRLATPDGGALVDDIAEGIEGAESERMSCEFDA